MSAARPMPAKRRAALEAELKGLRADPHWRAPKLRNRIDKIRAMLAPLKRQRRSRFEIEQDRHLGCRGYPNCDLDRLGCVYSAVYEDKC